LVTSSPDIPKGPGNICIRAAEAFFEQTGIKPGVEIGLTKNIPVGAGLGGGSSDAAATLLALDKLFGSGLGPERIRKIGATLGSDVAFFTQDKAFCLGRGRGERLSPLNWDMKLWHLVIYRV
jgi:4-diphosphocytidyl-2-C-methyl-D-erythritol kinase